jgi:hypothetical protein
MPTKALPTFFVIGAAKAGTTSLHHYLGQHPQIQMSALKEPNFFSGPENGIPYPAKRVSRLEDYERLFDPAFEARGEASPGYSNHPRRCGVPERIAQLVPNARFVYLVRDPIARTVSHYQHLFSIGEERRSLGETLADLEDPYLPLLCHSRYATQLELYLRRFPEERVLVVDHDELRTDRHMTLCKIFEFLAVERIVTGESFERELLKSSERRVYPSSYARLVEGVLAPATRWVPRGARQALRSSVERAVWPALQPPTLEDDLRERLRVLFAGEVERLRELTGQRFAGWSV